MFNKVEIDFLYNKNGGLSLYEYIEVIEHYEKDILNDWYWYNYDDANYDSIDCVNNGILDIIKFFRYLKVKDGVDKASVLRKVFVDYHNYNNEWVVLHFMPDAHDDYTGYDRLNIAKKFSENIGKLIGVLSGEMTIDSYVDDMFPNLSQTLILC